MKTTKQAIQDMRLKLYELPSAGAVTVPAAALADMLDDLLEYHKDQESLDRALAALMANLDTPPAVPKPIGRLRLVQREPPLHAIDDEGPKGGDAA